MGYILVPMAANRKPVRKSTKPKKSPNKKKPKVSLDNRKVLFIAALIIVLCLSFLSITFLFSVPESEKSDAPSSQPVELAKRQDSKKTAGQKKTTPASSGQDKPSKQEKSTKSASPAESGKSSKDAKPAKVEPSKPSKDEQAKPEKTAPAKTEKAEKPAPAKTEPTAPAKTESAAPAKTADSGKPNVQPEKGKVPSGREKTAPSQQVKKTEAVDTPPKSSPVQVPPASGFGIPPAAPGAKICFVIDDGGLGTENLKKYTSLPFPMAVAVLPRQKFTREAAQIIRSSGKELMLHQPMQAQNLKMNPGEGAIKPDMSLAEIYNLVVENLASLGPGVKGLNNHEGSLITTDEMKIGAVLDAATDYGVFFLDSRTTKDTMAPQAALERGISIKERDVFIDDIISREEMLKQIIRGIGIANKKGKCIMIGHVEKSAKILPRLLEEMYPELKAQGYALVAPSQIR